jgi:hypothetical protein
MSYNTREIGKTVVEYLEKFPTMRPQHLANLIFEKHPELSSVESIRGCIRYYRGKNGECNRGKIASDEFFVKPKTDTEIIKEIIKSTKLVKG